MVIVIIDFSEGLAGPKRPIKFVVRYITFVKKNLDKHKFYLVVVWLLGITQFVGIPQKWKQKLRTLSAEVLSLGIYFIFGDFYELVGDFLGVVNPCKVRVDAKDEEVHKTYDVISPAQGNLSESILTRKNNVTFEKYVLGKR